MLPKTAHLPNVHIRCCPHHVLFLPHDDNADMALHAHATNASVGAPVRPLQRQSTSSFVQSTTWLLVASWQAIVLPHTEGSGEGLRFSIAFVRFATHKTIGFDRRHTA